MVRLVLVLALVMSAAASAWAQTSLTIYSDGRVLARRVLPVRVPAGPSLHRLALGPLEPGSVFPLDSTMVMTGAQYDAAVDDLNTMRRAVGRRLVFRLAPERDTMSALVIGVDPERFQLSDGTVTFGRPGTPMYPLDLVLPEPTLTLALRAPSARPSLGLGWFSDGAGWHANYQVHLAGTTARIAGHAEIQAAGLRADSAQVQLLAGSVGRARGGMQDFNVGRLAAAPAPMAVLAREAASVEQVGEVYLYTVPGLLTLRPGVVTTAALFDPVAAPVERTFTVPSALPFRGALYQAPDEAETPVLVTWILRRTARTAFGDTPIPGGTVRVYQPDAQGRAQLVAEASVGHTAPGQELRIESGSAFDLTARRVQTAYATRRDSTRTIATVGYRVTVANAKDSTVTVDVLEDRAGEWRILQSSVPADRPSATRARFRVRVPARGQAVVTYQLQVIW